MTLMQLMVFSGFLLTLCISAAAFLCHQGKKGWGWFVFLAVVLIPSIHSDDKENCKPSIGAAIQKEASK